MSIMVILSIVLNSYWMLLMIKMIIRVISPVFFVVSGVCGAPGDFRWM